LIERKAASGRRMFLEQSLLVLVLGAGRAGRRLWAQALEPFGYQPLVRPVLVPLEDLATPGRAFPFVADGVTLPSAATPNLPVRISGMVVRTTSGDNAAERFRAVCVKCPHEGCDVDFVADPSKLPSEITGQIGRPVTEPVYVCPCHNSTFNIEEGARLAGPAPRGLYRFKVSAVTAAAVEIAEVEEDVLLFG
jgi:Rieske Fe-S protein